jgi:hypothetical protein
MNKKTIALIACAAATIGSFMPWIAVQSIFGTMDVAGTDGDGKVTLILGVIAGLLCYTAANKNRIALSAFTCGLGVFVSVYNLVRVNTKVNAVDTEVATASIGFGLWLCLVGFVVAEVTMVSVYKDISSGEKIAAVVETNYQNLIRED